MAKTLKEAKYEMPKGLPRPIVDGKPVPYSQEGSVELPGWGLIDDAGIFDPEFPESQMGRATLCQQFSLCLTCGLEVEEGIVFVTLSAENKRGNDESKIYYFDDLRYDAAPYVVVDSGPLHAKCGKLTAAHCPHIKQGLKPEGIMAYRVGEEEHVTRYGIRKYVNK